MVTRAEKPRCEIEFKLTAEYCQEMVRDEQRSIGSGVGSVGSKNTTVMGYNAGTAATTIYDNSNKQQPYI